MTVSCPPVLQRLELGVEAYVETPHRMIFFVTLYHYQLLYNMYVYIYQCITILHVITVSDHIAYVDACLAFVCVCTCIHVFTESYLMNNLGIACLVSWWLVLSRRMRRSATACLFHLLHLPEYWDYFHQLPRMIS